MRERAEREQKMIQLVINKLMGKATIMKGLALDLLSKSQHGQQNAFTLFSSKSASFYLSPAYYTRFQTEIFVLTFAFTC